MFYMVEEGELIATKSKAKGQPAEEVMKYKPGDYFGELALLKDQPRAANIICKTDCTLVVLDRATFKRMLGPIQDLLKRNTAIYEKYNK